MAKRTITVDMTGVETFSKVSEGIHTAKVKEINTTTTQAGDDALQVIFEVIKGEDKGGRVFETFTLIDKAQETSPALAPIPQKSTVFPVSAAKG